MQGLFSPPPLFPIKKQRNMYEITKRRPIEGGASLVRLGGLPRPLGQWPGQPGELKTHSLDGFLPAKAGRSLRAPPALLVAQRRPPRGAALRWCGWGDSNPQGFPGRF